MAWEANIVTFIGNLTADPELRFTQAGVPVASFRLASNRKWKDKSGQEQEDTTFMSVSVWRDMAENVAESLAKGQRVIAIGKLKNGEYEKDGQTVRTTEIEADEVAPSLRWARVQVTKSDSRGGTSSPSQQTPPPPSDEDVPF